MIVHGGAKVGERSERFGPAPTVVRRTVVEKRPMASVVCAALETNPKPEEIGLLEERLYEFNVRAAGTGDARLFAWFLRDENHTAIGGLYGWTWGAACYVRYLYVPENLTGRVDDYPRGHQYLTMVKRLEP
jgi:hypothetical protein